MTSFFIYLLQVSVIFTLLCLFYRLLLSKLTFHGANRCTLVLLPLVSTVLPFIELGQIVPFVHPEGPFTALDLSSFKIGQTSPIVNEPSLSNKKELLGVTSNNWLLIPYLIGCMLVFIRLARTTKNIFRTKQSSYKVSINNTPVYVAPVAEPLTYFNWIFIPELQINTVDPLILTHEAAHVRLRHTLDLLVVELYALVFWFNPAVYFYRKSLIALHEFQADQEVLTKNIQPADYLQLMLQTLENKNKRPTLSYFNNSIIKKRIDMITKIKSKKGKAFNYSLLVTTAIIISLAFSRPAIPEETAPYKAVLFLESTNTVPNNFPLETYEPANITSTFGKKIRQPKTKRFVMHHGIDIRASEGTPVLATADGTVLKAGSENNWGNLIVLAHPDGYQTWYAHLSGFETSEEQTVKSGDIIGYVGNTGRSSGPHLHYEVRKDDKRLDPMDFFNN